MAHERDAVLTGTLLCIAIVFGWLAGAVLRVPWLLAGVGGAIVAEVLAYRRAPAVQSVFDRPWVTATGTAVAGAAIGAGAILAPDRALSFAIGALGAYLFLLGGATVARRRSMPSD